MVTPIGSFVIRIDAPLRFWIVYLDVKFWFLAGLSTGAVSFAGKNW
jgi:hypothetical protein